jgi:regulator of RNase E activity RraA
MLAAPIPREGKSFPRLVAPISTMIFVSKDSGSSESSKSNIPADKHWTDCPSPGTVVLMHQPEGQICALLGDLVASRLKYRGIKAAVIHGRVRDVASCGDLCNDGNFQVWSKAYSTVGTGMEAKPWASDMPLQIGGLTINAGDIMVADAPEQGIVVIPKDKLQEVADLLPGLEQADDKVLKDVNDGVSLDEAFKRHRGHHANSK